MHESDSQDEDGNQCCYADCPFENVTNINQYPHHNIGLIVFSNGNNRIMFGTGFLIRPNLLLTVAHNICDRRKSRATNRSVRYVNHTFYPGINSKFTQYIKPAGYKIISYKYPEQYEDASKDKNQYDYAMMKLQESLPRNQQYMKIIEDYKPQSEDIEIYGYKYTSVKFYQQKTQNNEAKQKGARRSNALFNRRKSILEHKIFTQKGNSGSPVMRKLQENNEQRYQVIAIHQGSRQSNDTNRSIIFTYEVLKNLNDWGQMLIGQKLFQAELKRLKDKQLQEKRLRQLTYKQRCIPFYNRHGIFGFPK